MSNLSLKNGRNAGIVFGIIILIMFSTGFTLIGNQLVAKLIGNEGFKGLDQFKVFVIFMVLMGLWNGSTAARKPAIAKDELMPAIANGLVAGLVFGVFSLVISVFFGTMLIIKVDIRNYLVNISPESTKLFLFDQTPVLGGAYHFGIALITSFAGAFLAHFTRTNQSLRNFIANSKRSVSDFSGSPKVVSTVNNQYFKIASYLVLAALLIIIPRQWGSYWNYVFGTVGIYVLLGLGLNIITGWAGQLVIVMSRFSRLAPIASHSLPHLPPTTLCGIFGSPWR